ncbi:hypothetical protein PISMIDRAFT_676509 [Pisolithus microcarpus 441]|uniref:Uncharacterized protein n=1 Tax=Pisolithus microcarpus 441 TaxID=765257 RepID=A0A0C9YLZ4_9AGAM|nr:hypothetical protein PISMIDRAFT_676509 [Pisolithus microcarpus 441]
MQHSTEQKSALLVRVNSRVAIVSYESDISPSVTSYHKVLLLQIPRPHCICRCHISPPCMDIVLLLQHISGTVPFHYVLMIAGPLLAIRTVHDVSFG